MALVKVELVTVLLVVSHTFAALGSGCLLARPRSNGPRYWSKSGQLSPLPHTTLAAEQLPTHFDWRNVNGKPMVTRVLNQHMPVYCGSCWLHSATSVLSDRIKIAKGGMGPEIVVARQVVLNCGLEDPNVTAGSCDGGTSEGFFRWVGKYGLPDDTCQEYDAKDHECSPLRTCMNCQMDTQADGSRVNDCYPVQRYAKWFVAEMGIMHYPSAFEMQAEIYKRGPIACMMDSSYLEHGAYKPGMIVNAVNKTWNYDHEVSPVGWGSDKAVPYWIVRNSWGTFWGDDGWFRVKRGVNSVGIETECSWAVASEPVVNDWGPKEGDRTFPSVILDATLKGKDGTSAESLSSQSLPRTSVVASFGVAVSLVAFATAVVVGAFRNRAVNMEVGSEALLRA